jgi:hypothetical protein
VKFPSSSQRKQVLGLPQLGDLGSGAPPWSKSSAISRALLRIFGQSSTAALTSPRTRWSPLMQTAPRASSLTRSISTAIQDSMCDALSPSAIRWDRTGQRRGVAAGNAHMLEGTLSTLTSSPVSRLRVTTNMRVHDQVDGAVLANQFGVDGVHQERHVVGDDVDDAAVGPPATIGDVGMPGPAFCRDPLRGGSRCPRRQELSAE